MKPFENPESKKLMQNIIHYKNYLSSNISYQ
jgi:hypothetical protein